MNMRLGDSAKRDNDESCEQSQEYYGSSGEYDCDNSRSGGRYSYGNDECDAQFEERRFVLDGGADGTSAQIAPRVSSRWQQYEEPMPQSDSGEDNADDDGKYVTVVPGGKRRRAPSDIEHSIERQKKKNRGESGETVRATRKDGWSANDGDRFCPSHVVQLFARIS
jgi:hypothetical protein